MIFSIYILITQNHLHIYFGTSKFLEKIIKSQIYIKRFIFIFNKKFASMCSPSACREVPPPKVVIYTLNLSLNSLVWLSFICRVARLVLTHLCMMTQVEIELNDVFIS